MNNKIVSNDLMKIYFREVKKFPLLSQEEEIELAKAIENGDSAAKKRLTESNLRLVIKVVKEYFGRFYNLLPLDVIQEGNIGLYHAAKKFDYHKGYKFSTYAPQWILQAIGKAKKKQDLVIRVPAHVVDSVNRITKIITGLLQELGREPNLEEISEKGGIPLEKVKKIKEAFKKLISIDASVEGDDLKLGDLIEGKTKNPFDEIAGDDLKKEVSNLLTTITSRERMVIEMHYGIDQKEYTLEEIGKTLGLTRERVRQIELKAIRKLRHPTRSKKLKEFN